MRILWLTENYFPQRGGMAQSCDRIVYHLRQKGLLIDLLHICSSKRKFKETKILQGKNVAFPIEGDLPHTANLLWNYLERPQNKVDYDLILCFGGHAPMVIGPVFSKWMEVPMVLCLRGNDVDSAIFTPKRQNILFTGISASDAVCSVSKSKMERLQKWLARKDHCHYTPNGIDLDEWQLSASEKNKAEKWRERNAGPEKKVIGIFGHLKAKKGLEVLLEGIQKSGLKEKFHLMISGEWDNGLQKERLESGAFSYTHIPFMDRYELLSYYPACDLLAIPSHYEGMPNVLLEAGSLGIPILASNVDGMKDVLEEDKLGFLFHPGDADDCARAMVDFWKMEPAELKKQSMALQTKIRNDFGAEEEAELYKKIFMALKDASFQLG